MIEITVSTVMQLLNIVSNIALMNHTMLLKFIFYSNKDKTCFG